MGICAWCKWMLSPIGGDYPFNRPDRDWRLLIKALRSTIE